jgi:Flp pilus assembly protein TadD
MDSLRFRKARRGAALLASAFACIAVTAPAAAQAPQSGVYREDAAAALARHLRALAAQPKSLGALMGAGKAALQVGDPQAAITFYARAEEIAPRDGRIKAGFGSAFLAMEQPASALKFFDEAVGLGVGEGEIAGERGLAYDLTGDPRRAQRDYELALRRGQDAEVRRRLALSRAITGDRNGAMAAIQQQLDTKDRAAWRTRAFVLALTGDTAGATEAVQAVMPAQAQAMRPFLARLPTLSASQRALAVHYGTMPRDTGIQMARNDALPSYPAASPGFTGSTTNAGKPDSGQSRLGRRTAPKEPVSTAPRRRPGASETAAPRRSEQVTKRSEPKQAETKPSWAGPRKRRQSGVPLMAGNEDIVVRRNPVAKPAQKPTQLASAQPVRSAPAPEPKPVHAAPVQAAPVQSPPVQSAPLQSAPVQAAPVQSAPAEPRAAPVQGPLLGAQSEPRPAQPEPQPQNIVPQALASPLAETQVAEARPSLPAPINLVPAAAEPQAAAAAAASPGFDLGTSGGTSAPAAADFSSIAALIQSLPEQAEPAPAPVQIAQAEVKPPAPKPAAKKPEPKKAEAKKPEPKKAEVKKAEPVKAAPSRVWVQIAGGADKKALPREYARLKAKAPKLLGARGAWTTPLRATNRLLVGPFKTDQEAQAFVNELNKLDFEAFSWTSPAGQEIEKLAAT